MNTRIVPCRLTGLLPNAVIIPIAILSRIKSIILSVLCNKALENYTHLVVICLKKIKFF